MTENNAYEYIEKCSELVRLKKEALGRELLYHVETFGCQMNERDSEKLRGVLEKCGFIKGSEENCDLVLYNTCTVRENANTRVYGRLGQLYSYKKKNPGMIIGLCGCMMQEKGAADRIRKDHPYVDLVFGTFNIHDFAWLLYEVLANDERIIDIRENYTSLDVSLPTDRTYRFKSGVNIMYGCDNFCSYCIVPYVRGRERSRQPDDIIREINELCADGVIEIMLLGQNVNSYGKNLDEKITFARLLERICRIEPLKRVRFMTSHPKDLSDELIDVIAANEKVCRHIHLPVQSGSTRLLKSMNRHYTKESYLALCERIKDRIPDVSLTTDIIVGYPGETDEDIEDTLDVIRKAGFDSAFTFIYSKRSGTPAAAIKDETPEEVIKRRFDRVLSLVQKTGAERSARFEGREMEVLAEQINRQDSALVTGRLSNNITVHFNGDESLIGKIVRVRLDECRGFYYMGSLAGIPEE